MTSTIDRQWMARALDLAEKGLGWVNPNPKVGAVIARDETFLAEGYHERVGQAHAEVQAILAAKKSGKDLRGATLYVTLEPCCHVGRTGPCTTEILQSGIKRVVMAMRDPNPKVNGKGRKILLEKQMIVDEGVLEGEARRLNALYAHWISKHTPYVNLKMSISWDGKISPARKKKGEPYYLIGAAALERVHRLRQEYDGICVGIKTILQDDPLLTTRLKAPWIPRHPIPVILDSQARTPPTARLFSIPLSKRPPPLIFVSAAAPKARLRALVNTGARLHIVAHDRGGLKLEKVLEQLTKEEITGLMVEGGSHVAQSFLQKSLVHRLDLAIAPKIFGPQGVPMFASHDKKPLLETFQFDDYEVERLGPDLWLSSILPQSR